jgi:hypothetical protein
VEPILDPFTGRTVLPKDRLMHGRYYKGRCRKATIARYVVEELPNPEFEIPFEREPDPLQPKAVFTGCRQFGVAR